MLDGNYNVTVGDEACRALTRGDDNVDIGFEALSTDNQGSKSTAGGAYEALASSKLDICYRF